MSVDYSRLDQAIKDHIVCFPEISLQQSDVLRMIARQVVGPCGCDWGRVVDRRTQKLRKNGVIVYRKKRWKLADPRQMNGPR